MTGRAASRVFRSTEGVSEVGDGTARIDDRRDVFSAWVLEALGPMPAQSLRAMIDYGLTDQEIGRYYGLAPETITHLKSTFGFTDAR